MSPRQPIRHHRQRRSRFPITRSASVDWQPDHLPSPADRGDRQPVEGVQANPSLTGTVGGSSTVMSSTAGYTTTATQFKRHHTGGPGGSKAGDYSTTVAGASVTPGHPDLRPLSIVADNLSKVYGQGQVALTDRRRHRQRRRRHGLYTTTATQFSDVNGYAITRWALAGSKAADYSRPSPCLSTPHQPPLPPP